MEHEILRNLLTAPLWLFGGSMVVMGFLPGDLEINEWKVTIGAKATLAAVGATLVVVAAWICV